MAGRGLFGISRAQFRSWLDSNGGTAGVDGDRAYFAFARFVADLLGGPTGAGTASASPVAKAAAAPFAPGDGAALPAPDQSTAHAEAIVFELAIQDGPATVFEHDDAVAAEGSLAGLIGGLVTGASGHDYVVSYNAEMEPLFAFDPHSMAMIRPDSDVWNDMSAAAPSRLAIDGIGHAAMIVPAGGTVSELVLEQGSDYELGATDASVGAGRSLLVSAGSLGSGDKASFDGSAESDGSFVFHGGAGADSFTGGAKADTLAGGLGADRLTGGAGADTFVYHSVSESNGAAHDTLVGLNVAQDHIDLATAVTGVDAGVSGTLSAATFDSNLAAALGASALGSGHAALFTANAGDLSGHVFLVVDANGEAGYQAGADYVFDLGTTPPLDPVTTALFI